MLGLGTAARRVGGRAFATADPVSQEIRRRDQLHGLDCEFFPLKVESVKRPFAFQALIRNRKQRITIPLCFYARKAILFCLFELLTDQRNKI